jgi:hypothetical protein
VYLFLQDGKKVPVLPNPYSQDQMDYLKHSSLHHMKESKISNKEKVYELFS